LPGAAFPLTVQSQSGEFLNASRVLLIAALFGCPLACERALAQQAFSLDSSDTIPLTPRDPASFTLPDSPAPQNPPQANPAQNPASDSAKNSPTTDEPQAKTTELKTGVQTKRILYIIPNFRSVSASAYLPPQTFKEKLWLATQESFDYSSLIYEGIIASIAYGNDSEPTFGRGFGAYANYYVHNFADGTIENYFVEAFVPTITKEDPRYYTLGHGNAFKRTGYAISRVFITRTDAGNSSPNLSEFIGAGAAAAISQTYYPPGNTWVKTYQRWISQLGQDAISNIFKEFWPDINRTVFRGKYSD
jgi:hypothetical protein